MSGIYFNWIDELFEAIEDTQDMNRVREIVEAGYNINVQIEEGCTPLIAAVLTGNLEMVKLLVELGADVNLIDGYLESPLYYANYNGFKGIVEYLEPMTNAKIRAAVERSMSGISYPPKRREKSLAKRLT
ncbi:MAG: ankyrin repeat domain-containing protein [Nostoc sp.]|uniref:ankyrin repeat domain-containing protein n=1 Tax=Nostoc sp. TaxID=1180 RepID=UPI002FFA5E9D